MRNGNRECVAPGVSFSEWCRVRFLRGPFVLFPRLDTLLCPRAAVLEAVGLISSLDDAAVMRESIDQCRCELRIAEYAAPFREDQI